MKIGTMKQIYPGLRPAAAVLKCMTVPMSVGALKVMNRAMRLAVKGRWLGRRTQIQECTVAREDGSLLRLVICQSKRGTSERATGLLWIHGGGYAVGMPEQDFMFMDRFCGDGSCVAVMPDYRKSADAPYPAALEDCYLALRWMRAHAAELGINPGQLFVGGDSAGGGLTVATCLLARERGEVAVAFQMPLYPMLDDRPTSSSKDNVAPIWNTKSNVPAWKLYLAGLDGDVPETAAPGRARDLSGMPPACTFVGTIEPFYEETKAYVRRLRECGVRVHFREYRGCFHAFDMMGGGSKPAKHARKYQAAAFRYAQRHYYKRQPKQGGAK